MKKTGIELIAQERDEQINKHGYDVEHDEQHENMELMEVAAYVLTKEVYFWPETWSKKFKEKFDKKSYPERLAVAGALIAAELDRINA